MTRGTIAFQFLKDHTGKDFGADPDGISSRVIGFAGLHTAPIDTRQSHNEFPCTNNDAAGTDALDQLFRAPNRELAKRTNIHFAS